MWPLINKREDLRIFKETLFCLTRKIKLMSHNHCRSYVMWSTVTAKKFLQGYFSMLMKFHIFICKELLICLWNFFLNLFTAIKNMRDSTSDSRNTGARCLRVSPDGQTLATGDRSGNVRFVCFQYIVNMIYIL